MATHSHTSWPCTICGLGAADPAAFVAAQPKLWATIDGGGKGWNPDTPIPSNDREKRCWVTPDNSAPALPASPEMGAEMVVDGGPFVTESFSVDEINAIRWFLDDNASMRETAIATAALARLVRER